VDHMRPRDRSQPDIIGQTGIGDEFAHRGRLLPCRRRLSSSSIIRFRRQPMFRRSTPKCGDRDGAQRRGRRRSCAPLLRARTRGGLMRASALMGTNGQVTRLLS
jgi:hypothetical protein